MIFNFIGLGICAVAFGVAFVVGMLLGNSDENAVMLVAGPVAFVCDLLYRNRRKQIDGWWWGPRLGGQLFFIPVWLFGLLWMGIATFRLLLN
jgi:hypothetical protein